MSKTGGATRAKPSGKTIRDVTPTPPPVVTSSHHSAGLTRALATIEHAIIREKVEHAHVLASDGSTIFSKKGRKSAVAFTDDELAKMRGATVTHNHNVEVSFSAADVRVALQQQLTEMRAVSPGYRYSVRAPEKGWPRSWKGAPEMLYGMFHNAEMRKVRSALLDGRMTIEEANATLNHNVWTAMHASGLIHYEREPWDSGVAPQPIPTRKPRAPRRTS